MYIHVIIVAPEKISTPADIPWRREWRHSANSTPLAGISIPETEADMGNLHYCKMSSISDSMNVRECGRALSKVEEHGLA